MHIDAVYPTPQHAAAAQYITEFFSPQVDVAAILLMGSCARGKASADSCLDILVLVPPEALARRRHDLEQVWESFYATHPVFQRLRQAGRYSHVDLEFIDGQFTPDEHGWTTGPDEFELAIGNTLVYTAPLWVRGDYLDRLKAQWLPYYPDTLRAARLEMVLRYCRNNLDHIPLYVARGLYFQSFNRLYHALGEFLQALFIARRTYPLAYDKWVREQIEEILGLPDLYARLPRLLEIGRFESEELVDKARALEALVSQYIDHSQTNQNKSCF